MSRRSLRSRWFARATSLARAAVGLLIAACASLQNTPEQDLAWSRWTACRTHIAEVDIRIVQLDGRISFWSEGTAPGFAMLDCLREAAKDGPALPEAIFEQRPRGGG